MSGVAAAVRFDGGPAPLRELEAMIAAAPHRAPDGCGTWHEAGAALTKLHRLVMPGQQTTDQPFVERDGPHVTVVDGRLDDQLAGAGGVQDDAAFVSAAIARYGAGAVEHIHGDFAFISWNRQTRAIVAARDRIGIRPLHWAIDAGCVLIASDVAQVLAALSRRPAPDESAVADLLGFEPAVDARTLYAGVSRVPPGHVLLVDERGPRLREYWRPEPGIADERRSDDDYAEECRALLQRAVAVRLRATNRPVMFFSGGIDSSSVLSAAIDVSSRAGTPPPQPLSMVFDQAESDERAYRRAFAEACGLTTLDVEPGSLDAAGYREQAARRRLPPDLPAEFIGRPLMWRARALGARVALTGGGGDFLFGGSPLHYADLIRRGRIVAAIAQYAARCEDR